MLRTLIAVLACLLLPLAVLSTWTATVVGDTDEYVATVAPLAEDAEVQEATADRLVMVLNEQVPLGPAAATVKQAALAVVEGPAFPPVWRAANRATHEQLIRTLEDESAQGDVTIRLGGLVTSMAESLGQEQLAAAVAGLGPTFTVASSEHLEEARTGYRVLETLGAWLPVVWLVLVALALLASRSRRRTGTWLGFGSAITLGLLLPFLALLKDETVESVPNRDQDLARAVWDVLTQDLRNGVVLGIGLSLLVGVGFLLAGRARQVTPRG